MNRNTHFEELKELARTKRKFHNVDTSSFGLREMRKIYKSENITIDYRPLSYKIKALYMCDDEHHSVAIKKTLPDQPKLFALAHELKHHYRDQELLKDGDIQCGDFNKSDIIEVGAEVFAAEFMYPEAEFKDDTLSSGIKDWTKEAIVKFKRNCKAKVSYQFILKRLEYLSLINLHQFKGVQFQKLEDSLYGAPYHRRYKNY